MVLNLTKEQEDVIQAQLATGRFSDVSEIVGSALEALEERSAFETAELEAGLLEGVRDDHVVYGADTLDRIRDAAEKST